MTILIEKHKSLERGDTEPGLYIVATPIGNLGDITLRALQILHKSDLVACEDTRVTRRLLSHYNIKVPTTSYNDHNAKKVIPRIIKLLQSGKIVALVSDAGTPLISDPGYRLVLAAISKNIPITAAPGPVAAVAALTIAGLPTDKFLFIGFLPTKKGAKKNYLKEIKNIQATLVFYESSQRLIETLYDMTEYLGNRSAAVMREITKKFEETKRGSLKELADQFSEEGAPRGEIVIIVSSLEPIKISDQEIDVLITKELVNNTLRDSVNIVAQSSGRAIREVYKRALIISKK